MTTAHIEVKNLKKAYGDQFVLNGIDLEVNKGEIHVLLGASGSGKSTLLKCLNLLEMPSLGSIQIDDFLFNFSQPETLKSQLKNTLVLRKRVGMVFQNFNLWPHLTVQKNLTLAPMQVLGQSQAEAQQKAASILKKVDLSEKSNAYPNELSGGQQQRVAIARALMMSPEVLLFDEPTSALDPENVKEVLKVMQNLAEEGTTMLIATHEIGFAKNVASHALFLEQGRIIERGEAKLMLNDPQTERLRCFLDAVYY